MGGRPALQLKTCARRDFTSSITQPYRSHLKGLRRMRISWMGSLPSSAEEFDVLSEEMTLFLIRFGPRLAASRHGISERTLRRRFESHGLRLADYLKINRRTLAERLLLTDLPLTTVSGRLGFGSTQAFAHFMRREFGETATAIRKRLKTDS